jgi:hypothetical protein
MPQLDHKPFAPHDRRHRAWNRHDDVAIQPHSKINYSLREMVHSLQM